jgi:hypothetical protein
LNGPQKDEEGNFASHIDASERGNFNFWMPEI